MGYVDGQKPAVPAPARHAVAGRIGAVARSQSATTGRAPPPSATLIRPPAGAGAPWTFGPEIPVERRDTTRDFQRRRGEATRTLSFMRNEFRFGLEARDFGIGAGASLLVGEMPLGQRRVHRLRVQDYSPRLQPIVFEDLADLDGDFAGRQARDTADDTAAAAALGQNLRRNPYISDRLLSASLSSGDLSAFVSYGDGHTEEARQRADAAFALGLVADAEGARAGVYLHPRLRRLFDETGSGRLRTRFGDAATVALPPEVSDKASGHLELAIAQALCGAGRYAASWQGKPVGDYAAFLFEQHLVAALRRREGELPPTLAWREGFDPMDEDGLAWQDGVDAAIDGDDASEAGRPRP